MVVGLKQYGGEGTESYKGNKSDASLKQWGGEGKGLGKKSDAKLLRTSTAHYSGPGVRLG